MKKIGDILKGVTMRLACIRLKNTMYNQLKECKITPIEAIQIIGSFERKEQYEFCEAVKQAILKYREYLLDEE